jgi:HSP20 family protein
MFGLMPWRKTERNGGREMLPLAEYPLENLRYEMNELFNRFFRGWAIPFENEFAKERWPLNVEETEKEFVVHAEAPGFEAKEIEVAVTGDRLTVKAEHKEETTEKKEKNGYHYAERRFERTFTLPANTNPAKIEAAYKNGVIELHLPKTEAAKPRRIEVKT